MAINVRKGNLDEFLFAMTASYNKMRAHLATLSGTAYHADVSSATTGDFSNPTVAFQTVNSPDATSLATAVAIANEMREKFNEHCADTLAHKAADTTNPVTTAVAGTADQTACNALLNALKTSFNAHLTQSGVHYNNDSANTVSTANATNLSTSEALATALKAAYNAHIISAFGGYALNLIGP